MNKYTILIKKQRKTLGLLMTNFKAKGKALHCMGLEEGSIKHLDDQREQLQREYDRVTLELEVESRKLIENGLTPYDYAPDPEYLPDPDYSMYGV